MILLAIASAHSEKFLATFKDRLEGNIPQCLSYLLPDQALVGSIPSIREFFKKNKLSMLLRLINSAAIRKVDSGLKMLIEPI